MLRPPRGARLSTKGGQVETNMNETNRYSATEASALIASGKLTAVKLAEDCLARVAAREEAVQAWVHLDPQQVLADARARDAEKPRSALHGIPVAIKDI